MGMFSQCAQEMYWGVRLYDNKNVAQQICTFLVCIPDKKDASFPWHVNNCKKPVDFWKQSTVLLFTPF